MKAALRTNNHLAVLSICYNPGCNHFRNGRYFPMRILLVEDNQRLSAALKAQLEKDGYAVDILDRSTHKRPSRNWIMYMNLSPADRSQWVRLGMQETPIELGKVIDNVKETWLQAAVRKKQ